MFSLKQVVAVTGLGILAAYGGNGAFADSTDKLNTGSLASSGFSIDGMTWQDAHSKNFEFASSSIRGNSVTGISTDVSGTLYLGHGSSVALPSTGIAWNGSWGQTYLGDQTAIDNALADQSGGSFNARVVDEKIILFPWRKYGVKVPDVLPNVTPLPEPTTLIAGSLLLLPFAASAFRFRGQRVKMAKRIA
jgi:hypothetical protein